MEISFSDLKLLLDEAKKNDCLILLDDVPIKYFDAWGNGLHVETIDMLTYEFNVSFSCKIKLVKNYIEITTRTGLMFDIVIYKKQMTKEEYLTTLKFLKTEK